MGKCKRRSVVHEPQYETCKVEPLRGPEEITEKKEIEEESKERSGEKRKGTEEENEVERVKGREVKYIGETSRSGYERMREHWRDYENLSVKSHMIKHYMGSHKDIPMNKMKFKVKIIQQYRSSFERQIGESVWINTNLKKGVELLNLKNDYNRCSIPRLGVKMGHDEVLEEIREAQKEKMLKCQITELKETLMQTGKEPKKKKLKLSEMCDEIRRESYIEWYVRRKREDKRRKEENEREMELQIREREKRERDCRE